MLLAPPINLAPFKRYRIGELADHTGLSRQTLHNYTRWGLIQEVGWTSGGHRLYDESVFVRLAQIMALRPTRSIEQIRTLLNTPQTTQPPAPTEAGRQ